MTTRLLTIPVCAIALCAAAGAWAQLQRPKLNEDLKRLKVGVMKMNGAPVVANRDSQPNFTRELVGMSWRPLDRIDLYIIKPRKVANPPVALFCYSFPSTTKRFLDNSFCERLAAQGFAAVGFDSALTGDRIYTRPMREWFVSEMRESLVTTVHDVQQIIHYLASRGDLNTNKIGFFGTGSGATIGLLSATVEPRIKAVDMVNPWGAWNDWVKNSAQIPDTERAKYLNGKFTKGIADLDPVVNFKKTSAKLRLQIVESDPITPEAAQRKIWKSFPASQTKTSYADNDDFYRAISAGRLFDWLGDQLKH